MHESENWKWSRSVVSNSSQRHGLHAAYQAPLSMGFSRQEYWVLEWGAIAFSLHMQTIPQKQIQA